MFNMNTYANLVLLTADMKPRLFDLDFQLLHDAVLTLIAMFVLYFILSYLLFNPVRTMLEKRRAKIAMELAEAAEAEASAKALRQEYEAKLANIEKEADAILGEARKRALISENQIIAEAKAEARRIMDRAHVEAELEKSKLADEVKTEMIQIAAVLAGKVVAANINTEIQAELIDETLKEIGEDTWLS
jgi:F-type H+-transporting ATPase subunit b